LNGKCVNCKNGWTLNDVKDQCECTKYIDMENNNKCESCDKSVKGCIKCKNDGTCLGCDERI